MSSQHIPLERHQTPARRRHETILEVRERHRCARGASSFQERSVRLARSTGMMAARGGNAAAGGPARHVPVLLRQAIDLLNVRDGGVYIDGTFGAGGYARAILATAAAHVIGIDRDRDAIAHGA